MERAAAGDATALAALFERRRGRLEQMVRLRLDRRLQGRIDPADVLQEAYLELARRFPEHRANPAPPFYLWLRMLTGQKLVDLHRRRLGAKMRNAALEVSIHQGALPQASSASLAELLLGRLTTASRAAIRAETHPLPLLSLFPTPNHPPADDALRALFDRFQLRCHGEERRRGVAYVRQAPAMSARVGGRTIGAGRLLIAA
jgi:DNA-directed RNA polymerase specialized sigma24 family protein